MLKISRIQENDTAEAERIAALEQESFPDPWSAQAVLDTLCQPQAMVYGAWEKEKLIAYVICYYALDGGEIARIAVAPSHRRQGIAGAVLKVLAYFCTEKGIRRLMLEVRESNEAARAFYKKNRFAEDGIRKGYYADPQEDAVLMSRSLDDGWKC